MTSETEIFGTMGQETFENVGDYEYYARVINELNDSFHQNYRDAIQTNYDRLGKKQTPVIVVSGDHVTLFHDGQTEIQSIIPRLYQQVKSISHVSFGTFVTLVNNGYGPLKDSTHESLVHQLELMQEALTILDNLDIPSDFVALQRDTLVSAAEIVREVLDTGEVAEDRVLAFGEVTAPLYLDNAALAARLELDKLHEVVSRWRERIGKEDWENIYAVICAAHQARYRETTRQYFQRLLHEKQGWDANYENRVVYAEHIHDTESAMQLLARHLLDQKASVTLFGSRTRLQEDLMSDGAAEYLNILMRE